MSNIAQHGTKDRLNKRSRSNLMARVKSKDTCAEIAVRHLVFKLGFRYRLHRKGLPGTPDLVFPSRRKVIFVHGCFWHGHNCTAGKNIPVSNVKYWTSKLRKNKTRDKKNLMQLAALGWDSLIIWECDISKTKYVTDLLIKFLNEI